MKSRSLRAFGVASLLAVGIVAMANLGCDSGDKDKPDKEKGTQAQKPPPTQPTKDLSDPKQFFANLYQVAKAGDAKAWANVLSKKRRERGDAYVQGHFKTWRGEIVFFVEEQAGGNMDSINVRMAPENPAKLIVEYAGKKQPMKVILEDGALRIDES